MKSMRALAGLLVSGTVLLAGPALADACVDEPRGHEVVAGVDAGTLPGATTLDTQGFAGLRSGRAAPADADPDGECWALLIAPRDPDRHV